jgi:hypothetical protein
MDAMSDALALLLDLAPLVFGRSDRGDEVLEVGVRRSVGWIASTKGSQHNGPKAETANAGQYEYLAARQRSRAL